MIGDNYMIKDIIETLKIINDFKKIVHTNNEIMCNKLKKVEQSIFLTKEFFSINTSERFLQDVNMSKKLIFNLSNYSQNVRYIDMLIRNMCEQVIEYIYIMRNPQLIEEYFNFDFSENCDNMDYYKLLNKTNFKRFSAGRESISKMAKQIGEKNNAPDEICLYNIYIDKSAMMHNSYFNSIFLINIDDDVTEEYRNEIQGSILLNLMYITYIIGAFLNEYNITEIE